MKSHKDWFKLRLIPWLKKAWEKLEINGHMVINIEDIIKTHGQYETTILFSEAMVLYVTGYFSKCKYLGIIGHKNVDKKNVRPLYVWIKLNTDIDNSIYRIKFKEYYVDYI
jgi:hypothetical protein